ncbi:glycosyltransferase [Scytonema sp. UIC 10036]|uniref:glycosyltransferase n=1 Tax=Scytonema sp. UIC 10036 TaxID=2304196 RepID=UPI0013842B8F|nr:glycosyltransferase [Scytonema sp. UIC 10036]
MKVSVLINNYNYQQYVVDAINSVINQSVPVSEIIVVDDKSTDDSVKILQDNFANHETVNLVLKEVNQGQLSSFNEGFNRASGDIICFLDADDLYKENYIQEVVSFYKEHPKCDFLFCSAELFGNEERIAHCYDKTRDLGISRIITLYSKAWIGHRTSTVSMRRQVLENLLPIPYLEDWRIRADDCLVYGASIVGARKFYLANPLVKYRVHGNNGHYGRGKERTPEYLQKYDRCVERLFSFLVEKMSYSSHLCEQAHTEFQTIPHPLEKEFKTYRSLVKWGNFSFVRKIIMLLSLYTHYYSKRDAFH